MEEIQKIYYKSSFSCIIHLYDKRSGCEIGFPDYDFRIVLYTTGISSFVIEKSGDKLINCINDAGKIRAVCKNHRLAPGIVKAEIYHNLPNIIYPDGIECAVQLKYTGVELTADETDIPSDMNVDLILPYIKGEPFTYEDFTPEQIAELQGPAREAADSMATLEENVEAAEKQRRLNEESRARFERDRMVSENDRKANEELRIAAEKERIAAENEREEAETSRRSAEEERAREFATWESEIDSKADRTELSNVLAREPGIEVEDVYMPEMKVFDDEWVAAGGTVIVSGVTYGCNGTNDLTYEEAVEIKQLFSRRKGIDYSRMFFASSVRALLPIWIPNASYLDLSNMFQSSSSLTKIVFLSNLSQCVVTVKNLFATFHTCEKLKEIEGILDVSGITSPITNATFLNCGKLEEVRIRRLQSDIFIGYSPLLSFESLAYMIANAANTTAVTVTVHPDVYAKLTDESNTEWHALIAQAAEKNITFATV